MILTFGLFGIVLVPVVITVAVEVVVLVVIVIKAFTVTLKEADFVILFSV